MCLGNSIIRVDGLRMKCRQTQTNEDINMMTVVEGTEEALPKIGTAQTSNGQS